MALSNYQYEVIMRGYGERQLENRRELLRRRAYLAEHVPQYLLLEQKAAEISVFYGKRLLSGTVSSTDELHKELEALAAQKRQLLLDHGLPEDYLAAPCKCADCQDTGFIGNEKCHCFVQQEIALLFSASGWNDLKDIEGFAGLSDRFYEGEDLTRFRNALDKAHAFVDRFGLESKNLLFYGTVGTGKSYLSACIAKELLQQGYAVLYFSAISLFQLMGDASFGREDTSRIEHLYNCDLLIIDDLGCEMTNRFTFSQLFQCINERALRGKSTIISTNLSLEEIKERYTDRILSRLIEQFDLFRFSGPDIRILKKTGTEEGRDYLLHA